MSRLNVLVAAAVSVILLAPVSLFAGAKNHRYEPHFMASVEEASNRVQFLSPHFMPLVVGPKMSQLKADYTLQRLDENRLGINLSFSRSGVNQKTQYFWSWTGGYTAPVSTPYQDNVVTSIVYADIESFSVWNYPRSKQNPESWCVSPVGGTSRDNAVCLASEPDAYALADALATLTVAFGTDQRTYPGVSDASAKLLQQQVADLARKNGPATATAPTPVTASGLRLGIMARDVTQADATSLAPTKLRGILVMSVEKGGLADVMQLQVGDVILEVNGSEVAHADAFAQLMRGGSAKRIKVWRKSESVELVVPQSM